MELCEFCHPELNDNQIIILENDVCRFMCLKENAGSGRPLEGSGVIVTKAHRLSPFELTDGEWIGIKRLLNQVKEYTEEMYQPDGFNIGWNVGETGGQHIPHCHLHIIPRYSDESLAGQGIRSYLKSDKNTR